MRKYDSYKDSGVEWIGEIPKHWKRYRIQYLLSMSSAGVWGEEAKGDENDIICFRMADFDYEHGCLKLDNLTLRNITPYQLKGREFHRGDLMLEKSGGGDVYPVGRVVRVNTDLKSTCSNFAHAMATKNDVSSDFLYYYFFSLYVRKINMLFFNQTTGIQNLKVSEYLGQTIYLPNYAEQQAIASYLDRKTSEIDKLMAEREKRIKLLEELKASVISHAVTKGLDPDAKMKPSGVEWIGDIPEEWEACRFKNFLYLKTDNATNNKLVKVGLENIESKTGRYIATNSEFDGTGVAFVKGDILYGKLRPYLQKVWLAEFNGDAVGDFFVFKAKENVVPNFVKYLLLSDGFTKMANGSTFGAKMPRVSSEFVLTLRYFLPPIFEQKAIISFLDHATAKIEVTISTQRREISLLRDYKQSLITEVVTGKRKVV